MLKQPSAAMLAVLAVSAIVMVAGLTPVPEAIASDVRLGVLTSADAGATQVMGIPAKTTISLQCTNPACYRTGATTAAAAPDCTLDAQLPAATTQITTPYKIETGGHLYMAAKALDAGNPDCRVFTVTKNPVVVH